MNTNNSVGPNDGSLYQTFKGFAQTAVKIDSLIDDNIKSILYLLSYATEWLPGKELTYSKIKDAADWVGYLDYVNKLYLIGSLQIFEESKLKAAGTICKTLGKTGSIVLALSPLVTTNPVALAAMKTSSVFFNILKGTGMGLTVADMGNKAYEKPEKRTLSNALMMIGLSSITYLIMAPILLTAAPGMAIAATTANLTLTSFTVIQLGSAIQDKVVDSANALFGNIMKACNPLMKMLADNPFVTMI